MVKILRKNRKLIFWILMFSFVIGTIFISWGMRQTGDVRTEDIRYARIEGYEITEIDVSLSRQRIIDRYKQRFENFDESDIPDLNKRAIDETIKRRLLLCEAKRTGIFPTDKEVIQTMRLSFPDDATYNQARKVWPSSYWRFKENEMREELCISKLEAIITDLVEPTNFEVKEYFDDMYKQVDLSHILIDPASYVDKEKIEEHYEANKDNYKKPGDIRARHILVALPPKPTKEQDDMARQRIADILQQIRSGGDFAELAMNNSDCQSRFNGGDLGFFGEGRMVPEFEKAAYALEPGGMSDIVKTDFGYHIIKCEEKKPDIPKTLKEAEEDIRKELRNDDDAVGSASKTADLVYEKIKHGTITFEEGVKLYSNAPISKKSNGRIGVIPRFTLPGTDTKEIRNLTDRLNKEIAFGRFIVPEISELAFSLKEGEIGTPTKTGFGFHIIKVNKFLPPDNKRLKDEKEEIEQLASRKKKDEILGLWYDWLKKTRKVKLGYAFEEMISKE
ncbi:TPA: hypothetical protein DCX16_06370 [bacterium]|nr:hypothetical protein [bacterium]